MHIQTTEINEYTKITITKERFDVAIMKELKDEIGKVLEDKSKILIDMSMVNFLDSSGLSVLISILKSLNKIKDSDFKLCSLNKQPYELMEMTQLYNVFDIRRDCDAS